MTLIFLLSLVILSAPVSKEGCFAHGEGILLPSVSGEAQFAHGDVFLPPSGGGVGFEEAAVFVMGAQDISQIPEDDLERLRNYLDKPLKINLVGRSSLISSSLFSAYQVSTIIDYRNRCGPILSATELSVIDGFNPQTAKYISTFLDFVATKGQLTSMGSAKGNSDRMPVEGEVSGGYQFKIADGVPSGRYYAKGSLTLGSFTASIAARQSAMAPLITIAKASSKASITTASVTKASATKSSATKASTLPDLGWSVSYTSRTEACRIILGRFNARFAQGLVQWSGLRMENFSTPQALMLHPSGISPYTSYSISNSLYGLAGAFTFGRFATNLYAGFDGPSSAKSPVSQSVAFGRLSCVGSNASYLHRHGSISANANYSVTQKQLKTSADFQQMIGPVVAWAELCFGTTIASSSTTSSSSSSTSSSATSSSSTSSSATSSTPASFSSVFGTRFPLLRCDIALSGLYSPEKHSLTLSANRLGPGRKTSITLAGMMVYNTKKAASSPGTAKLKIRAALVSTPLEGWKFSTLLSARLPSPRYELRQDITRELRHWLFTLRADAVKGLQWAGLTYLEGGYKREKCAAYCQCGLFFVDKWDDRIYVYRRDAPGSMSIPAMYGRGWYAACYSSLKIRRFAKLYLRVDYTAYPFARQGDTHTRPSLNARFQFVLDF